MHKTVTAALSALLASSFFHLSPAPRPPALPGPGGVAAALTTLFERLDAGEGVQTLFDVAGPDLEFVFVDGSMQQAAKGEMRVPSFHGVGPAGEPFAARDAAGFAVDLGKRVASDEGGRRRVRTTVDRIRANCQSEQCSLATVDFTRRYERAGQKPLEQKLRATALLRWERHELGDFRIYHWHASMR